MAEVAGTEAKPDGFSRRRFIKGGAIGAAWSIPVVQTLSMSPAGAQTAGSGCGPCTIFFRVPPQNPGDVERCFMGQMTADSCACWQSCGCTQAGCGCTYQVVQPSTVSEVPCN